MSISKIPLRGLVNTDSIEVTSIAEEPKFDKKSQLFYNGALQNTYIKASKGIPLTSGKALKWERYAEGTKEGVQLVTEDGKKLPMPYTSVLTSFTKHYAKASGKQVAHCVWDDKHYTLYRDNERRYTLVETDSDDNETASKQLDCTSAMICSVYKLDEEPRVFLNKTKQTSSSSWDNTVSVHYVSDLVNFTPEQLTERQRDSEKETVYKKAKKLYEAAKEEWEDALNAYNKAADNYAAYPTDENAKVMEEANAQLKILKLAMDMKEHVMQEALFEWDPDQGERFYSEEMKRLEKLLLQYKEEMDAAEEKAAPYLEDLNTKKEALERYKKQLEELEWWLEHSKAPELSKENQDLYDEYAKELNSAEDEMLTAQANALVEMKKMLNSWKGYAASSVSGKDGNGLTYGSSWSGTCYNSEIPGYLLSAYSGSKMETLLDLLAGKELDITLSGTKYVKTGGGGWLGGSTRSQYGGGQVRVSNTGDAPASFAGWGGAASQGPATWYTYSYWSFNYTKANGWATFKRFYDTYTTYNAKYASAKATFALKMSANEELSAFYDFLMEFEKKSSDAEYVQSQVEVFERYVAAAQEKYDENNKEFVWASSYYNQCLKDLEIAKELYLEMQAKVAAIPTVPVYDEYGRPVMKTLEPLWEFKTSDGVPLGEANSGTTFKDNQNTTWNVIGFDDDDKNRALILIWNDWNKVIEKHKWFGTVGLAGDVTGEPIPDPDEFTDLTRRTNGTYQWDLRDGSGALRAGSLIGGYTFNSSAMKFEKLVVDTWAAGEQLRTNISVNDVLPKSSSEGEMVDPKWYYVSNFADSRGIYYEYGQGWLRTYVRKANLAKLTISDCYIYTFGCVTATSSKVSRESLMAKGKTAVWDFLAGSLNKRIYTVGGTNKADDSILSMMPFSVQVIPDDLGSTAVDKACVPQLRMQMYGLVPLSFSFNQSLVTNGEDHSGGYQVQVSSTGARIVLSTNSMTYEIEKTSDPDAFKIWKVADYYFSTNILSDENIVIEDRLGNVNIERGAIPYCGECVLDIEKLKLNKPEASQLTTNNSWYWMAAFNPYFITSANSSYIMPAIVLPLYVSSDQLEQFQQEALEQRGSLLKPMLKGLFDEYEGVDIFYTLATVTTTLYYKTTNVVKTSNVSSDLYDVYGKETFNIDMKDTTYSVSGETQYFPLAIGSIMNGINYITPTVELEDGYAARLYTNTNRLYGGYQYSSRIYQGSNIFTIYGRNYYYDGQGIYFIGTSGTYTSNQFVCYALGMKFLANSGSEAYLYSPFDKRIYVFTGSNTVQEYCSLSNLREIKDSVFSSQEQTLYVLTYGGELLMVKEKDMAKIDGVLEGHLEGTEMGAAISNGEKFQIYSPRQRGGMDHLPFELETQYLGNDDSLLKLSSFDFLMYKASDNPVKLELTVHTLNGIERKEEKHEVVIQPSMWKGRTYRLRYSPRNNVGNSFKVGLYSDNETAVTYHAWSAEPYGVGSAPRNSVSAR